MRAKLLPHEIVLTPPGTMVTEREWRVAIQHGFRSNGGTMSPDRVWGMRIANKDHSQYPPLPTDLHDLRYWVGGDDRARLLGDQELLHGIQALAWRTKWPVRELRLQRAQTTYRVVRMVGAWFWNHR